MRFDFERNRPMPFEKRQALTGFLFILPFVVGAVLFMLIPLAKAIQISLCVLKVDVNGYVLSFTGLGNFNYAFNIDPNYRKYLLDSLLNMLTIIPVVFFSFFMASLLNTEFHGRTVARAILFLPVVIASGAVLKLSTSDLATSLISGDRFTGMADSMSVTTAFSNMLTQMDMDGSVIQFLVGSVSKIYDITIMSAVPIIIFLAGFQSISPSIYEASYIEGATKWEVFWKISFPMVSPMILLTVVYCIIDTFTSSSNTLISVIHQRIYSEFNYGLGMAMSFIYMLVIFAVVGLVYVIVSRYVFYYD